MLLAVNGMHVNMILTINLNKTEIKYLIHYVFSSFLPAA